jgi:hypothetical protein
MREEYGIQGEESEINGRNSNQGNKDIRNNEDIIKLTQNDVNRNSEETLNQEKDETTSDDSDDKNVEEKFSQLDVHGSVHHDTYLTEMTNKMQLCRTIYHSIVP